jgi:hypothetical protein
MKLAGFTIIVSFMILSLMGCQNKTSENKLLKSSDNHNNGLFLIHIVSVQPGDEDKFIDHLDSIWDLLPDIRELPPYYSGRFIKELHVH